MCEGCPLKREVETRGLTVEPGNHERCVEITFTKFRKPIKGRNRNLRHARRMRMLRKNAKDQTNFEMVQFSALRKRKPDYGLLVNLLAHPTRAEFVRVRM